ncbi:MAG: hypothetical protein LQ350_007368 [Teloschistes chrysophthalmus]|nr:MAG: hypothetical protein LQ350_007368 [Niorma chrysophthalma]
MPPPCMRYADECQVGGGGARAEYARGGGAGYAGGGGAEYGGDQYDDMAVVPYEDGGWSGGGGYGPDPYGGVGAPAGRGDGGAGGRYRSRRPRGRCNDDYDGEALYDGMHGMRL